MNVNLSMKDSSQSLPLAAPIDVHSWLKLATQQLSSVAIATARLDALVLLEDETGKDRSWLLAHPEYLLRSKGQRNLTDKLSLRIKHVPLAYIRGKAEFYGRDFTVSYATLVPRPETEAMIELIKSLDLPAHSKALDVGTGSGCIAITVALEYSTLFVDACDIDSDCIAVATENAHRLGAKVNFFVSDLLRLSSDYDIILANLPYVPDEFPINAAAAYEPSRAIFGGPDGLNLYRKIFTQLKGQKTLPHFILTESLPFQHAALNNIAKEAGFSLKQTEGLVQLFEAA